MSLRSFVCRRHREDAKMGFRGWKNYDTMIHMKTKDCEKCHWSETGHRLLDNVLSIDPNSGFSRNARQGPSVEVGLHRYVVYHPPALV